MLTDTGKRPHDATREHTPNNPFQPADSRRTPHWWEDAACRTENAEAFFPPMRAPRHEKRAAERQAKKLCFGCPVRAECLQAALDADERHGIWGGLTARERRRMFGDGRKTRSTSQ